MSPVFVLALVLALLAPRLVRAQEPAPDPAAIQRGEYLARAADCLGCHTDVAHHGVPLAGGRALTTPFGVFFSPNITPDKDTGIGGWGGDDLRQSLRHGHSPLGEPYYPSHPYTSYSGITDSDVEDLASWLLSRPPVRQQSRPHQLDRPFAWRWTVSVWRLLFFAPRPFQPDPARPSQWNRGAYLVEALGHCGECHTARDRLGRLERSRALAGSPDGAEGRPVPDITPRAIGGWSAAAIAGYLATGARPDGRQAAGPMRAVIDGGTSHLTPADRQAIAIYLLDPPR